MHLAIFVFLIVLPFAGSQFNASLPWLFVKAALILAPLYGAVALMIYALQSQHGEQWRARLESLLRPVPLLGTARHYLALSRLAAALEALISAGVNVIEAWNLAATASGSPAFRRALMAWKLSLDAGQTPPNSCALSAFPETFANLYASGEVNGKLEEPCAGFTPITLRKARSSSKPSQRGRRVSFTFSGAVHRVFYHPLLAGLLQPNQQRDEPLAGTKKLITQSRNSFSGL